ISAFLRVFNFQHKEKRLKKIVQNGLFLQSKAVFTAFFNESYLGGPHGNYSMVELLPWCERKII
ncbi:TPA: hypothetical protein ACHVEW_001829, partial [Streptococcus suis]